MATSPAPPTLAAAVFALTVAACGSPGGAPPGPPTPERVDPVMTALAAQAARFAPTDLSADVSGLPESERTALAHMIRAAQVMDGLFLQQVWAGNPAMLSMLASDESPRGQGRLRYFLLNKGPWSRLDHNEPFIPGVPAKPAAANFYPPDATKAEVEQWIGTLSGAARQAATGFFTTIRRGANGQFLAVPYSLEYQPELALAASHLRAAAAATTQPTLKAYLEARAAAFLSNDYYESDVRWMELDATLEPTIGPYEVYEDEWFNYKAAFEAFITVKDQAESARLQQFAASLQEIEDNLPIAPRYRNPKLGSMAPIAVVNTVFSAGDGNRGVQTAAFNLPNDERVVAEKGSKRVMLKNNQQAKFETVLLPIAQVALAAEDRGHVAFDAFFTHILMHELVHGLGPHNITVGGRATTVRQELKDTSSAVEEAKADITGLFALQFLIDKGRLPKEMERTMYTTFLASAFRSIRFGISEAHGLGQAVQLNYLLDQGAFAVNPDGTFAVVPGKIRDAVAALARDLMTMQAVGDYAGARTMLDTLGVIRPSTQAVLDKLKDVPVDIAPRFPSAAALLSAY